jgi:hypothetical protein
MKMYEMFTNIRSLAIEGFTLQINYSDVLGGPAMKCECGAKFNLVRK